MKKSRMLVLFAAFAVVASAFYGGHEYFKPNPDMVYLNAAFRIETSILLQEFNTNDSAATRKYLGKVIITKGTIRGIEKNGPDYFTVVLGDLNVPSSIRCSIDSHHLNDLASLKAGSYVEIKGVFTGYNRDETGLLGSDAQLNRCVVVNKK
jgi:hypothetical protein